MAKVRVGGQWTVHGNSSCGLTVDSTWQQFVWVDSGQYVATVRVGGQFMATVRVGGQYMATVRVGGQYMATLHVNVISHR